MEEEECFYFKVTKNLDQIANFEEVCLKEEFVLLILDEIKDFIEFSPKTFGVLKKSLKKFQN